MVEPWSRTNHMASNPCYYCGSHAHQDNPCPVRSQDAERFAKAGQAIYPRRLTVRYQVVSSDRTKILHQNGKVTVPGVWEEEETQNVIQETIQKLHPGWVVSGWALVK